MHRNGFRPKQHPRPGILGAFADAVVQLEAGHRAAGRRERRAGPVDFQLAAESAHPQSAMPDAAIEPIAETQSFQSHCSGLKYASQR